MFTDEMLTALKCHYVIEVLHFLPKNKQNNFVFGGNAK